MRRTIPFLVTLALVGLMAAATQSAASDDRVLAPASESLEAIRATLALDAATWYNDRDGDKVFDDLEQRFLAAPSEPLSVIIVFTDEADHEQALAKARAVGGFEPLHQYRHLNMTHAMLNLDQALRVAALDEVRQIDFDAPGHPELDTATATFGADAVQDLLGYDGDRDGSLENLTGLDVGIAILDTGFHGGHKDLEGRFSVFYDTEDGQVKDPFDSGTHGSHVAGIAGGSGAANPAYKGVAPGAQLIGIKISGGQPYGGATGSKAGALAGYDFIIGNLTAYNIRVSTISFGFGFTTDGTDSLELAVDKAFAAGVLNFKSTGNSGPEKGTVTIPGGARGIVATASMHDAGPTEGTSTTYLPPDPQGEVRDYGFHLSTFSSRGPTADGRVKPNIAAPGSSISSVDATTDDGYAVFSGTSMASPFAAGTAALVFDANPALSNDQARRILYATAEDWGPEGPDIDYGAGRLDAMRAVQTAAALRMIDEGAAPFEVQQLLGIEGPVVPRHEGGIVTDQMPTASFLVEDAGLPVAVTTIQNSTGPDAAPTARVIVFQVVGPDESVVGKFGASPQSRQQAVAFVPTSEGEHEIQFLNLVNGDQVIWDVSAGIPVPEVPINLTIPGLEAAGAGIASSLEDAEGGDAAGPAPVAVLLSAGVVVWTTTRTRQH